ncbi:hypothetical protein DIPPA_35660 [Diplonema papillatum]|nr:hypothetical protein DIPPA_35660 [Diplonema papillatum]
MLDVPPADDCRIVATSSELLLSNRSSNPSGAGENPLVSSESCNESSYFLPSLQDFAHDIPTGSSLEKLATVLSSAAESLRLCCRSRASTTYYARIFPDYRRSLIAHYITKGGDKGPELTLETRRRFLARCNEAGHAEWQAYLLTRSYLLHASQVQARDVVNSVTSTTCALDTFKNHIARGYVTTEGRLDEMKIAADGMSIEDACPGVFRVIQPSNDTEEKLFHLQTASLVQATGRIIPELGLSHRSRCIMHWEHTSALSRLVTKIIRVRHLNLADLCPQSMRKSRYLCRSSVRWEVDTQDSTAALLGAVVESALGKENLQKLTLPDTAAMGFPSVNARILDFVTALVASTHLGALSLRGVGLCSKPGTLNNRVSAESFKRFRSALASSLQLEAIDFSNNALGDEMGLMLLTDVLSAIRKGALLRSISMADTGIGPRSAAVLGVILEEANVVFVDISRNHITAAAVTGVVAAASARRSLQTLNISGNAVYATPALPFRLLKTSADDSLISPALLETVQSTVRAHPEPFDVFRVLVALGSISVSYVAGLCVTGPGVATSDVRSRPVVTPIESFEST